MGAKGGGSKGGGGGAFGYITIGVTVLSLLFGLFSKNRNSDSIEDTLSNSITITPPYTEAQPLPRTYGTNKVNCPVVWWGNLKYVDSTAKEIQKRYY